MTRLLLILMVVGAASSASAGEWLNNRREVNSSGQEIYFEVNENDNVDSEVFYIQTPEAKICWRPDKAKQGSLGTARATIRDCQGVDTVTTGNCASLCINTRSTPFTGAEGPGTNACDVYMAGRYCVDITTDVPTGSEVGRMTITGVESGVN